MSKEIVKFNEDNLRSICKSYSDGCFSSFSIKLLVQDVETHSLNGFDQYSNLGRWSSSALRNASLANVEELECRYDLMFVDSKQPEILAALVLESLQSEQVLVKDLTTDVIRKNALGLSESIAELLYSLKIQEMLCAFIVGFDAYRMPITYTPLLHDEEGNPFSFSLNNQRIFGELLFDAVEMESDVLNVELLKDDLILLDVSVSFRLLTLVMGVA